MNENASSNITQVLTSFQNFINVYENPLWVKNATVEEIKTTFKLGHFIEKTILKFKDKGTLEKFFKILNEWSKEKHFKIYDVNFYELANDQIIEKLFKFPNIKESTLDIGVRVYTSIYPKERFNNFIQKLILTSSSFLCIADFVNSTISDTTSIETNIILNRWSVHCTHGQKSVLKAEIENYLSLYKVETMLPKLINMLSLKDLLEPQKEVQTLVLESVLEKMLDRSLLSKTYWLVLFQKTRLNTLTVICSNSQAFLESLLNFIEYIGSLMHRDYRLDLPEWTSDPQLCFCPEITYFDVLNVLRTVCQDNCVKEYVLDRLEKAKEHSNAKLWNELINEINPE